MMTREDYVRVSEIVEGLMLTDPDSHEECVWNMALKLAAGMIRREAAETHAPWAEQGITGTTVAVE